MIVAELLRQRGYRPSIIVHVGAHHAQEREEYATLDAKQVVWIEGDPTHLTTLRANLAAYPTHVVIQALITDIDGGATVLNIFSNEGMSSSVYRSTKALRDHWPDVVETGEQISLPTSTLDTALQRSGIDIAAVDVLVLDIQGAELLALRGAEQVLARVEFVEVEVSMERIYDGGPLAGEIESYLDERGFVRLTDIPWHGDAVFQRRRAPIHVDSIFTPPLSTKPR